MNQFLQRFALLVMVMGVLLVLGGCFGSLGGGILIPGTDPGDNGDPGGKPGVYDGTVCIEQIQNIDDVLHCFAKHTADNNWNPFFDLFYYPLSMQVTLHLDPESDIGGIELAAASSIEDVESIGWFDLIVGLLEDLAHGVEVDPTHVNVTAVEPQNVTEVDGQYELDLHIKFALETIDAGKGFLLFLVLDVEDDRVVQSFTMNEIARDGDTVSVFAEVVFEEGRTTCSLQSFTVENRNSHWAIAELAHQEVKCAQ